MDDDVEEDVEDYGVYGIDAGASCSWTAVSSRDSDGRWTNIVYEFDSWNNLYEFGISQQDHRRREADRLRREKEARRKLRMLTTLVRRFPKRPLTSVCPVERRPCCSHCRKAFNPIVAHAEVVTSAKNRSTLHRGAPTRKTLVNLQNSHVFFSADIEAGIFRVRISEHVPEVTDIWYWNPECGYRSFQGLFCNTKCATRYALHVAAERQPSAESLSNARGFEL